jgi:hypothetical protein
MEEERKKMRALTGDAARNFARHFFESGRNLRAPAPPATRAGMPIPPLELLRGRR